MDKSYLGYLKWSDYLILSGMLAVSLFVGIYFAFFAKRKQNTTSNYLMGGQQLATFPVATSLAITQLSGPNVVGLSTEMYMHGTQLWIFSVNQAISNFVMIFVYYPVYRKLKLTSVFEYLRKRFNHPVRLLGSVLYLIRAFLLLPIMIYVPALFFSQMSGLNLNIGIPVITFVSIMYTTLGGISAVVWTDAINITFTVVSLLTIAIIGTYQAGGIEEVWEKNKQSGRIEFFNMGLDPRIRHTFWNVLIGKFFTQLSTYSTQQSIQQRLLSLPSLNKARSATLLFAIFVITLMGTSCYIGLVISAHFADCDPFTAKIISKPDQILSYFVMNSASNIPIFRGIFITSIVSTSIGGLSVGLNATAAVIMIDFIKPLFKHRIPEVQATFYTKANVVICGIIIMALTFVIDKLGLLHQMASSLSGMTDGTILGVFTLGILFPWANNIGAMLGSVISLILLGWISIGAQIAMKNKEIVYPTKPLSVDNCDNSTLDLYYSYLNQTEEIENVDPGEPFALYTLSYTYYTLLGVVATITFGLIISFMTHPNDSKSMDPNLFSPVIHKFLNVERDVGTEMKLMKNNGSNCKNSSGNSGNKQQDDIADHNL